MHGLNILVVAMRDSMKTALLLLALLVMLGTLGWLWFEKNFERREKVVRSTMSLEARRNPMLAAEMFLSRLGLSVESRTGREYLIQPPEDRGLLLVRDLGPPLTESAVTDLLAWIEQGGHLLAAPSAQLAVAGKHSLLAKLGVSLVDADEREEGDEVLALDLSAQVEGLLVDVDMPDRFVLDESSEAVRPLVEDPRYLVFPWGAGFITLISDSGIFTNSRIGKFEHARLLAHLAPVGDPVWLLHSAQMPSLLSLVWRWAPHLVVTLVLLGLFSVWWMSRRSGAILASKTSDRRDLLEHLQASAEFAWRNDLKAGLLEGARHQVEKRWLSAHPLLLQLDQEARCDWLAKRTGLSATVIFKALYPEKPDTVQMIKNSINLQRLLAALHPDRKVK
ncbi:MAG: DUF4350 domain-containing protein [Candidatus Thiodiazotropha lotti]|uniref:DUF4350 domain-containing protein n=1 Tax=Candidatus Thiodiazotropha lotti TaxID=2792787 RepID=A0A9E4N169_9GAMM|nr:DUF4350 domain-containing protein [Candidatus Thiodiazotropha lotti]MCG7939993.1 DUF4350 domain-containing protein [Candidatus Thiodiazotropha lotti]MCG7988179.1 DUF4350 domain-containing protein [Candidatus Thiodiazotropha lotti]MCG8020868.1 DUF4350 domain-containing protein [Candidatus Thiodiazotropha lotti]MCW4204466.1 DUF4350 domain-containing protein [Candidatus Thiodiazotropha lotti]